MKKTRLSVVLRAYRGKAVSLDFLEGFSGMTRNSVYWYISKYKLGQTINGELHVA